MSSPSTSTTTGRTSQPSKRGSALTGQTNGAHRRMTVMGPTPSLTASVAKAAKAALPLTDAAGTTNQNFLYDFVKGQKRGQDGKEELKAQKVSLLALLSYSTTKERILMVIGLFCAAVAGCGLPAWLVLLANSLDKFNNLAQLLNAFGGAGLQAKLQEELNRLVMAFFIVGCIALVCGTLYVALWTYTGEQQALRIKEKFVRSAMKQDAEWFDTHNREELPTKMANAMVHIQGAVGRQIADTFANAFTSAGCLVVAFLLNAWLALIMLLFVPFIGLAILVISCFVRKSSSESADYFSQAGATATECISGIKTVASLCIQPWALDKYETAAIEGQQKSIKSGLLSGLSSGITGFILYCSYTVAFIVGTEQVAADAQLTTIIRCLFSGEPNCRVTGASIMCCIYGVILCATFFGLMGPGIQSINLGRSAAGEVFATIKHVPGVDASSSSGKKLKTLEGGLELRDVFFTYPTRPKDPIFYDFNLLIKPGESHALVGPSGSGKSTIAKLLLRFYDPSKGDVMVDGYSLKDLNVAWWRSQVGYVSQRPTLFPGTIRYNIACGIEGREATDAEVEAAAKAACAHEFIMDMPDGYSTFYSGTSIQLSGGQMQRISIARAIIANPAVLLLDEATSALDSNSEAQVQRALENIRKVKKMTTVTVAHRLSTIMNCDQINVINKGSIAEQGTHRELFEMNGIYTTLCESQGITADSVAGADAAGDLSPDGSLIPDKGADEETGIVGDEEAPQYVEEDEEPMKEELAPMSRLWKYNMSEWLYIVVGVICAGGVGALSPCEAILTARIVTNYYIVDADEMIAANRRDSLLFLAFAAGSLVANTLLGWCFSVSGFRLTRKMRCLAFDAIIRHNVPWFDFPEHSTGELTTRLEADSESVSKVTGWQLAYRVRIMSSMIAGISIALAFSWQIGLVAIACVPLIMIAAVVQALCFSQRFVKEDDGLSPATILEQGLRGISAVQAYNLQGKVCDDYSESLKPEAAGKVKLGIVSGCVYGFSQFAIFASFAIIFYVGSKLLTTQGMLFVDFFTSILAVMFGAIGVASVNADFKARQDGQAAAARIFAIADDPLDSTDPFCNKGDKPSSLDGSITYDACYFSYPTRPNNLIYYKTDEHDGVSLSIAPKESVAFVGKSGCGKSTALQLALRFYEPTGGTVSIDGHIVDDLNVMWLRSQIGYVGQQPILFSGTVKSNILLGKPDATDDEIREAAKAANAHEFIMDMSNGYDSDVGTGGSLLSGGQVQRIAIARAIVKNPKILVLDEATSALDNESERIVQAALDELQKTQPRTTLVVAHRLVSVKGCDRITVLDDGGVAELGSHDELLKQKGLYYELWSKQGAKEEEEEEQEEDEAKGCKFNGDGDVSYEPAESAVSKQAADPGNEMKDSMISVKGKASPGENTDVDPDDDATETERAVEATVDLPAAPSGEDVTKVEGAEETPVDVPAAPSGADDTIEADGTNQKEEA